MIELIKTMLLDAEQFFIKKYPSLKIRIRLNVDDIMVCVYVSNEVKYSAIRYEFKELIENFNKIDYTCKQALNDTNTI